MASSEAIVGLNNLVANRKSIQKLRRGKGPNVEPYSVSLMPDHI